MPRHRATSRLFAVETLGQQVRARLAELGWTQVELARQSGVSSFTVQRMCSDDEGQTYRLDSRRRVASALGWTPDSIDRVLRGEPPVEVAQPFGLAAHPRNDDWLDIRGLRAEDKALMAAMAERLRQAAAN